MTNNKKFILVEIFLFLAPLIAAFVNATYSSLKSFPWGYDNINVISVLAIVLAILGNIFIYWKNKNSTLPSKNWKFISLSLIIFLLIFLYFGYSLSNFGF